MTGSRHAGGNRRATGDEGLVSSSCSSEAARKKTDGTKAPSIFGPGVPGPLGCDR